MTYTDFFIYCLILAGTALAAIFTARTLRRLNFGKWPRRNYRQYNYSDDFLDLRQRFDALERFNHVHSKQLLDIRNGQLDLLKSQPASNSKIELKEIELFPMADNKGFTAMIGGRTVGKFLKRDEGYIMEGDIITLISSKTGNDREEMITHTKESLRNLISAFIK